MHLLHNIKKKSDNMQICKSYMRILYKKEEIIAHEMIKFLIKH